MNYYYKITLHPAIEGISNIFYVKTDYLVKRDTHIVISDLKEIYVQEIGKFLNIRYNAVEVNDMKISMSWEATEIDAEDFIDKVMETKSMIVRG